MVVWKKILSMQSIAMAVVLAISSQRHKVSRLTHCYKVR